MLQFEIKYGFYFLLGVLNDAWLLDMLDILNVSYNSIKMNILPSNTLPTDWSWWVLPTALISHRLNFRR